MLSPGFLGGSALGNGAQGHRYSAVQRVTGALIMLFSLANVPPLFVNLIYGESVVAPFLIGLWITLTTGAVVWWPVRDAAADLKVRDGFLITVLFWAVLGVFGAIPLYFADQAWHSFTDAVFESVSGLTTTGATVVPRGLDELPHALNFYRMLLHWLGGVGIIVLAVAILPMLGVGGMQLYKAETQGPMKDAKLTPRIAGTARALWIIYVTLTLLCGLAYWVLGMDVFDAICHAMSTLSTGGFSTHDASIGYYNNPWLELAVMFFMVVGATNFALHFLAWRDGSIRAYFRDGEFKTALFVILLFGALVCAPLYLLGVYPTLGESLRKGMFTLIAYGTDAGFAIADPTPWPLYVPLLVVLSGFMVGSSGSTAGGIKVVRVLLLTRQALREMRRLVHPNAHLPIKLEGRVVPDEVVYAVSGFFSVYITVTALLTFVMMATGMDAVTAFSAVAACLNNEGPGLGSVNAHMLDVSTFGKWVLIVTMMMGRLEIFTLLIVFTPGFWRR
ncbi:MAG: potassium transporter [Gammaproteobacteria bacterium]|nr:potassium transporter [Gammaproteobacteria bacterium]